MASIRNSKALVEFLIEVQTQIQTHLNLLFEFVIVRSKLVL